ncbi:hypothetical protein BT96DRAFT_938103 [Gymnopus androsaceus JB14]|uniref:Uncharacterized protein n=1 Tax=Gymnopus androsaceus JB14 TaxID=1447944 RepID=A0A6A4HU66_9AGAR|nr:hypothetical protein BT96DRAFT_938103 [Gymnopus androsaceus JB14]
MNARAISSTLAYKHTNYSFYRYVVEDGETRIVEDDPVQSHPKDTNNEASFGNPTSFTTARLKLSSGGENPSSPQKARKVFLVNGPPISGGKFGPGRLESAGFHSQTGGGTTFWYASQDTSDLEYPRKIPPPRRI